MIIVTRARFASLAVALSTALTLGLLVPPAADAAAPRAAAPAAATVTKVRTQPTARAAAEPDRALRMRAPRPVLLPAPGRFTATPAASGLVRAAGSPALVGAVTGAGGRRLRQAVQVEVLPAAETKRLGGQVAGLRVRLPKGARSAQLGLDTSGIAGAYGGNYADRLRLYAVPDCAAATPAAASCRPVRLAGTTDANASRLVATVPVSTAQAAAATPTATVVALAAADGNTGNYTSTSLAPSQSWNVGLQSGSFQWNYPVPAVPAVAGQSPKLAVQYDSGSVDGRSTASNGQTSWLGQGFDLTNGYVERRYESCSDDGIAGSADLCWSPKLTYVLSLNGSSYDLIPVVAAGSPPALATEFRTREDSGWLIRRLTGRTANGDDDGEYWELRQPDGTVYRFGYGTTRWTSAAATNSVLRVPVLGNNSGEPCNAAGSCLQAYRWNVDDVQDSHGNATTYLYTRQGNRYAKGGAAAGAAYDRSGYLNRIEYGERAGAAGPTAAVDFLTVGRCVEAAEYPFAGGSTCPGTPASAGDSYPDVPGDLICTATCNPTTQASPTFFDDRRLYEIRTSSITGGTAHTVDRIDFRGAYVDPDAAGSGESAELRLEQIRRTGESVSPAVTTPPVVLGYTLLANRIDTAGVLKLRKYRLSTVGNETGGRLDVDYGHASTAQTCTAAYVDTQPDASLNTKECFPAYWTPSGGAAGFAWFHKYVVTRVSQTDPATGVLQPPAAGTTLSSEPTVTDYEYVGTAALHHDDNPTAHQGPPGPLSWGQWLGYGTVIEHRRALVDGVLQSGDRARTKYTYFRGWDGDKILTGTGRRSVTFTTTEGVTLTDSIQYRGQLAERTDQSATGAELERRYYAFTSFRTAIAPNTPSDMTTRDAFVVRQTETRVRKTVGGVAAARKSRTVTTYRAFTPPAAGTRPDITVGMADTVDDQGDESITTDSRCSRLDYTFNSGVDAWLVAASRTRSWAGACDTGTSYARTDSLFDTQTALSTGQDTTLQLGENRRRLEYTTAAAAITTLSAFDAYGRPTSATDGRNQVTNTAYTPAAGRATSVTVTRPSADGVAARFATTTATEPDRGLPTRVTDPNGAVTTTAYDALGRLVVVRKPGQQAQGSNDSIRFAYTVSNTAGTPSTVRTEMLQSDGATPVYVRSWDYVDGWGRTVQSQTSSPGPTANGRILAITRYDDRGKIAGVSQASAAAGAAGSGWLNVLPASLNSETRTTYDALGRTTASITLSGGVERYRASSVYDGDGITTTPAAGGKVQHLADIRGNVTTVREYDTAATPAVYATTTMAYSPRDQLARVTSPKGAVQQYQYDLLGRRLDVVDPDTGHSTAGFDANNNQTTSTDARGVTVNTDFDNLNRPTRRWTGAAATPTVLSTWAYDTAQNGKGRQTSMTSKVTPPGTSTQKDYVVSVPGYDPDGRPTGTSWSVPSGFGLLTAVNYTQSYSYDAAGHVTSADFPAIGGLQAESVASTWSSLGTAQTLSSSVDGTMVFATSYDDLGRVSGRNYGGTATGPSRAYAYDGLNRVSNVKTQAGTNGDIAAQDDTFTYAGRDLTKVTDNLSGQRQCYVYDALRRLSRAWTTPVDCTDGANPSHTGTDPYDQTWTFDTDNSLLTFKEATGAPRTLTYTGQGTAGPAHAPAKVSSGGLPSDVRTLAYDSSGGLLSRTQPLHATETSTWDEQRRLVQTGESGKPTRYAYAADGSRLIRQTKDITTLYLGDTEIDYTFAGVLSKGRRNYSLAGVQVALRTCPAGESSVRHWLTGDRQATTEISIEAGTGLFHRTRYTPYGHVREFNTGDTGTALPTDKGWLGKTLDKTAAAQGLNALDKRYFDNDSEQFLSPDPVFKPQDPRTINPYTYAFGNPILLSDPSGLFPPEGSPLGGTPKPAVCTPGAPACTGSALSDAAEDAINDAAIDPKDYTTRHNQALAAAKVQILLQLQARGATGYFVDNWRVTGAAKKCMGGAGCSYGIPDIVWRDSVTNVNYVWEVKSVGQAGKAQAEASWYVSKIKTNGGKAVLGWSIGGPYPVFNGDVVFGPAPGAVIYGRADDQRTKKQVQQMEQAKAIPQLAPTTADLLGDYPGVVNVQGRGMMPAGSPGSGGGAEGLGLLGLGVLAVLGGITVGPEVGAAVALAAAAEYVLAA